MTKLTVRFTHRFASCLALAILLLFSSHRTARAEASDDATVAITSWLQGIDAGKYKQGWLASTPEFQKIQPDPAWSASVATMREALGPLISRHLLSARYTTDITVVDSTDLRGFKGTDLQGYFVIARYDSNYTNLKTAIETVTFAQQGNTWKASGYDVRPLAP